MTSKVLMAALMPARIFLVVEVIRMLAHRLRKLPTALAHRDQLRRLAGNQDYLLADVGLTRDDIDTALSAPFWRDPSAELVHRLSGLKAEGQCQHILETTRGTGQPVVSSPRLLLAACNRRRLPVAPV